MILVLTIMKNTIHECTYHSISILLFSVSIFTARIVVIACMNRGIRIKCIPIILNFKDLYAETKQYKNIDITI